MLYSEKDSGSGETTSRLGRKMPLLIAARFMNFSDAICRKFQNGIFLVLQRKFLALQRFALAMRYGCASISVYAWDHCFFPTNLAIGINL